MRGMAWPLPSVVAGSFRTALVKGMAGLDFSGYAATATGDRGGRSLSRYQQPMASLHKSTCQPRAMPSLNQ
jgi:hypothetical protein